MMHQQIIPVSQVCTKEMRLTARRCMPGQCRFLCLRICLRYCFYRYLGRVFALRSGRRLDFQLWNGDLESPSCNWHASFVSCPISVRKLQYESKLPYISDPPPFWRSHRMDFALSDDLLRFVEPVLPVLRVISRPTMEAYRAIWIPPITPCLSAGALDLLLLPYQNKNTTLYTNQWGSIAIRSWRRSVVFHHPRWLFSQSTPIAYSTRKQWIHNQFQRNLPQQIIINIQLANIILFITVLLLYSTK